MSFNTQARMSQDQGLLNRVAACAAGLGVGADGSDHPVAWANNNSWRLAASTGWAEVYAASQAEVPGVDESAVTDEMIRDAVRSILETGGDV